MSPWPPYWVMEVCVPESRASAGGAEAVTLLLDSGRECIENLSSRHAKTSATAQHNSSTDTLWQGAVRRVGAEVQDRYG